MSWFRRNLRIGSSNGKHGTLPTSRCLSLHGEAGDIIKPPHTLPANNRYVGGDLSATGGDTEHYMVALHLAHNNYSDLLPRGLDALKRLTFLLVYRRRFHFGFRFRFSQRQSPLQFFLCRESGARFAYTSCFFRIAVQLTNPFH